MRFVQLRAFHHVAINLSFSRAAKSLHLSQPAISDQVLKLESEYDIKLFDRQTKQITLTEDGRALLEITHRLFEVEQRALALLSESREQRSGTLRIIADSAHHVTRVLARFRQDFPEVFISVSSGNSAQVLDQLIRYEADIGVLGNMNLEQKYDVVELNSTAIVAFAASTGPFGRCRSVSLAELASWPLVLRERGSKTRALLEEIADDAGIKLNVRIEAEGREAVRQIVTDGGGVGIVSDAEFINTDALHKIPILNSSMEMKEALVCLRSRRENQLIDRFMLLAEQQDNAGHSEKSQLN